MEKLNTKIVEKLIEDIPEMEVRRKDKYGRLFPNVKGKTAGYISDTNKGVSWNANFGSGRETKKISDIDELKNVVENFGKPISRPSGMVSQTLEVDDNALIPESFIYHPRKLDHGETDVETFEWAMNTGRNVFLIGPTGSGKTALARYFCAKHKRPYRRFSFNGGCTVEDLIGHWVLKDGATIWIDGILTQAARRGWILVGDELNAASADVLFVLNSVLDDERILVLSQKDGEVINVHPNFRFVATANPTEQGYAGTNELNEALKDRFTGTILIIDYNDVVERKIVSSLIDDKNVVEDIMSFTKKIRRACLEDEIITPFSTRSVMALAELIRDKKPALIVNRFRDSEKAVVMDTLEMFISKTKKVDDDSNVTMV